MRREVSGYAVALGVRFAVLTNGARWEVWKIVAGKSSRRTYFIQKNIGTGNLENTLRELMQLHRGNLGRKPRRGTTPSSVKSNAP